MLFMLNDFHQKMFDKMKMKPLAKRTSHIQMDIESIYA